MKLFYTISGADRQASSRRSASSLFPCGGFVSAAFAGLVLGASVYAQDVDVQAELELDPFAVEAFRLPFSVEDFPGSGLILDQSEIRASGAQNLAEILESAANIPLRSGSGNTVNAVVDLRGHGESGFLRTLILIDGQPLNRADMSAPTWMEVPLGRIAQVEILRGPQTARFGDLAVGGVINIVTRLDPSDTPETQVQAGVGAWSSHWQRLNHSRPLGGGAVAVALEHNTTDGYRENSAYEAISGAINYAYTWENGPTLRTGLFYLEDQLEFPGALPGGSDGGFPDNPRDSAYGDLSSQYFSDNRKMDLTAALVWPMPDAPVRLEVRGGAGFREFEWNFGPGSHADLTQQTLRLTPEFRGEIGENHTWGVGLALEEIDLEVDRFADQERSQGSALADLEKRSVAVFGHGEFELSPVWTLHLAVRAEENRLQGQLEDLLRPGDPQLNFNRSRTDSSVAWQVGTQWKPREGSRGWIRYDRLYRFPVADEVAFYQGFPNERPFNADLDPERGHNVEAGWEWTRTFWSAQINFFAQKLSGEIAYDYRTNHNANLADTRRVGTELSLTGHLAGWRGRLAYTWIDATFTSGDHDGRDVPLVSPHIISAQVKTPRWAQTQLTGELVYRHRSFEGSDFANVRSELPGWTVVNVQLETAVTDDARVFLRLNNVFDREYATLKYFDFWYPAAGRHLRAGLEVNF